MRRASVVVSLLAVVPLVFVALGRTGPTAAQDANPPAAWQGFGGSWQVTVTEGEGPPLLALGTSGADGTLLTSPPPVLPPMPGGPGGVLFTSAGHGVWQATGPDTAVFTFVVLVADGEGNPLGTHTVRASITLGPGAQTFSGEGVGTVADPAGNLLATEEVTVQAARIVAEAPEMPAA